jgi:hypothetical protein
VKRIILSVLFAQLVLAPLAAAAGLTAAQKSAICQTRATCTIGTSFAGGKSPAGSVLTVVAVHLGLQDKSDDAPETDCRAGDKFDGGIEYWLLDGTAPPRRLLALCNDGYGAAGVGEDDVTVGANSLVHSQIGGSAWRWQNTVTFTLAPWRATAERDCSYYNASPGIGTVTDIDYLAMSARSIAKDSASKRGDDVGCPTWPHSASQHFTAEPAPDLLGAYNILIPILGTAPVAPKIPAGTAIGDCVPAMTTAGVNGFLVFGKPAPAGQAAELRVIAESLNSVLVQVLDPIAGAPATLAGGSWINLPHIEFWIGLNTESVRTRLALSDLAQVAVDLNGKVYAGAGKPGPLPSVERWEAHDAAARPVVVMRLTWPNDDALLNGAAIVYSQAEAGRQARLVASTGIVKNHPLYVPDIISLANGNVEPRPTGCHIRDGRLSMEMSEGSR